MKQGKLLPLVILLLLLSVGIVVAQSSSSYEMQRFVTLSGGAADSTSYAVTSVIGQPLTDVVESANYKVSGGFLHPYAQDAIVFDQKLMVPVVLNR